MSRKSIFELLNKEIDFSKEVERIRELFSKSPVPAYNKKEQYWINTCAFIDQKGYG